MNINTLKKSTHLESQQYQQLFENNSEAILELDKTGQIIQVNDYFSHLFEYTEPEILTADIGFFIYDAFGGLSFAAYAQKLTNKQDVLIDDFFGVKKTGTKFKIQVTMSWIYSVDGPKFILFIRAQKLKDHTNNVIEYSEHKLHQSQSYASIGHWHYNFLKQKFEFSHHAKELLSLHDVANEFQISDVTDMMSESDKHKLRLAIEGCQNGLPFNEKVKLSPADEKSYELHLYGNLEWHDNQPFCIHGLIQNASEKKIKTATELSIASIIEHSLDEILIFDCESLLFVEANKLACRNLGFNKKELTQMHPYDVLVEFTEDLFQQVLQPLYTSEQDKMLLKSRAERKDGSQYFIDLKIKKMLCKDKEIYIAFADDVTDRETLIDQLYQAKDEAERANKAKSEFLSRMSHELRTPMNAILGFSQLMTFNKVKPLDIGQLGHLSEITKAGDHLLNLINEVLELSRLEAGRVSISLESLDIQELVNDICLCLQPVAKNYAVSIINHIREPAYIKGDRMRLKQVLLNLLSNAVKYGNQGGGDILVTYDTNTQGQGVISVTDQGQGIAEDKLNSIFMPFERLETEDSHIEGSGIGLTISKQMTELMGGNIGVDSTEGLGSCFWVALPCISAAKVKEDLQPKNTRKTLNIIDASDKSILYIEDNPANLKLVERMFALYSNCHFLHAPSASIGLELARAHQPDLILMDIHLPGISGIQAKTIMDGDLELMHIPVIAVSASALEQDIKIAKQAGFVDYITKPFQIDSFLTEIEKYL